MDDIENQMREAETMLRAGEAQIAQAGVKLTALRALADKRFPHTPWPTPKRALLRSLLAHLCCYAKLAFFWPTHRFVRLMPGAWLQIDRGASDAQVVAALAAYLRNLKERNKPC